MLILIQFSYMIGLPMLVNVVKCSILMFITPCPWSYPITELFFWLNWFISLFIAILELIVHRKTTLINNCWYLVWLSSSLPLPNKHISHHSFEVSSQYLSWSLSSSSCSCEEQTWIGLLYLYQLSTIISNMLHNYLSFSIILPLRYHS